MTEIEKLHDLSSKDEKELIMVWEESVRATHDFLTEADLQAIKQEVREAVTLVDLFCLRDKKKIIAFMGIDEGKLEMLFIHPAYRGQGLGRMLVLHALSKEYVKYVDVNEQNEQAVGFYEKMGFKSYAHDELDSQGRPFPILHMWLVN